MGQEVVDADGSFAFELGVSEADVVVVLGLDQGVADLFDEIRIDDVFKDAKAVPVERFQVFFEVPLHDDRAAKSLAKAGSRE